MDRERRKEKDHPSNEAPHMEHRWNLVCLDTIQGREKKVISLMGGLGIDKTNGFGRIFFLYSLGGLHQ